MDNHLNYLQAHLAAGQPQAPYPHTLAPSAASAMAAAGYYQQPGPASIPPAPASMASACSMNSDVDLGHVPLNELLHGINPALMSDFNTQAPTVVAALLRQHEDSRAGVPSLHSPPAPPPSSSDQDIAVSAAAAAAAAAGASAPNMQAYFNPQMPLPPEPLLDANSPQSLLFPGGPAPSASHTPPPAPAPVPAPGPAAVPARAPSPGFARQSGNHGGFSQAVVAAAAAAAAAQQQQTAQHAQQQRARATSQPRAKVGSKRSKAAVKNEASLASEAGAVGNLSQQDLEQLASAVHATQTKQAAAAATAAVAAAATVAVRPLTNGSSGGRRISSGYPEVGTSQDSFLGGPGGGPGSTLSGVYCNEEDDEGDSGKKAMRAERNRQSAAASRERKKHHIRELERRVSMLSAENAQLQVGQLDTFRQRIAKERELTRENRDLKKKVVIQNMKINDLSRKLEAATVNDPPPGDIKRPATWSHTEWGTSSAKSSTAKFSVACGNSGSLSLEQSTPKQRNGDGSGNGHLPERSTGPGYNGAP